MLKCFAAFVLILGCFSIGQSKNARLSLRLRTLRHMVDGLMALESEIRHRLSPLPEALEVAGRFSPLFSSASLYIEREGAQAALRHAAAEHLEGVEEQEILESLASGLLSCEETGLLQSISLCRMRTAALLERLETEGRRLAKLYSGGGAAAGFLAVILLL